MKKLIHTSVKAYLIIMGTLTGLAALAVALLPAKFAPKLIVLPLLAQPVAGDGGASELLNYKPLVQHWAILLVLVGAFMVAAAFKREWERPAMAISGVEKAFVALFGWLIYPAGFVTAPGLILDTIGAVYSLLYFAAVLMGSSDE